MDCRAVASSAPSETFGAHYADVYDLVVGAKDYELECRVIERLFAEFSDHPIRYILDVGCGTGSHAVRLAVEGRHILGIDSSNAMIERARAKAIGYGANLEFVTSSLQEFARAPGRGEDDVVGVFDAVLLMSTVLGYVASDEDILGGLRGLRRQVRAGAVLLADLWFGPAVVLKGPSTTFRKVESGDRTVLRLAEGSFDLRSQIYRTTITVWDLVGEQLATSSVERHDIRVFFPKELGLLLSAGGFELAGLYGFPDTSVMPSTSTWSVLIVAKAV